MQTVNIHDAKTNLSRLIERTVTHGEAFVIAKAGKPMVKVVPIEASERPKSRIGFMAGRLNVPDDFDDMGRETIETLFEGR